MGRDHRRIFFLAAKSAARFHLHDAHAISGQIAEFHQRFVYVVRALERAPYSEALLRVEGGDHSVIFDIELFLRPGRIFTFDDIVSVFP